MTTVGRLIAAGRTSDVYEFGPDAVVKLPRPSVPDHWAALEAANTAAARTRGVPVPAVLDLVEVEGRSAIVLERVRGSSLWDRMLERPTDIAAMARLLADVHRQIFDAGPPDGLLGLADRLRRKLADAPELDPKEVDEALAIIGGLPSGAALLHGDLHPGNVLLSPGGPVVIDWFDASVGHPVGDIVRSSLLLRPSGDDADPPHLPGADAALLQRLHDEYVRAMSDLLESPGAELVRWEAVRAAGRLAEGAVTDSRHLLELWRGRSRSVSVIQEALTAAASGPRVAR